MSVSIAILAGGMSSRMGYNKSFAIMDGSYLIVHTLTAVRALGEATENVFIVANDFDAYQQFGVPVVRDVLPKRSSLNGLYSALWHSSSQYTLCLACDMPFVKSALLKFLIDAAHEMQAIVPSIDGQVEALCAVYDKSCMAPFRAALDADSLKIQAVLASLRTRYVEVNELRKVDPDLASFININTPDELARQGK